MSRATDADAWRPPARSPGDAAHEAYEALRHLEQIDLRKIADRSLREDVYAARRTAEQAYRRLWSHPETATARRAWWRAHHG